ncbi:MAG: ABC transporter substrate-binding protein [Bdellovibrionales bacterium]|nr:ABC transporter substrate-binding protein [Bdellovibrionales bacterium]
MNTFLNVVTSTFLLASPSLSLATESTQKAPSVVRVGAVEFPPYIHIESGGKVTGLLETLLNFMNKEQSQYIFQAIPISAMRRHGDFKNGDYNLSFFDNIDWGWDKNTVDISNVYMRGKEVYIAKRKPDRTDSYFNDLSGKSMIGILGYHYGFANYNADPAFLRKKYNMQLSNSNEGSIKMILFDRGDIAVVSDIYLNSYLKKHPEDKAKLLISNKTDQQYSHTVIVRKNTHPTVQEINLLLNKFQQSKEFKEIISLNPNEAP